MSAAAEADTYGQHVSYSSDVRLRSPANTALETTRVNVAKIEEYNRIFRVAVRGAIFVARVSASPLAGYLPTRTAMPPAPVT